MIACLVDTDILIDASRGIVEAIEFLKDQEGRGDLAVSVITQMELLTGCRDKAELRVVNSFLRRFEVVPLDELISTLAVKFVARHRLSHGLQIPDALIAATASARGYWLASKNRKHYHFIRGLKLLAYR
jgi:hypothetical protein